MATTLYFLRGGYDPTDTSQAFGSGVVRSKLDNSTGLFQSDNLWTSRNTGGVPTTASATTVTGPTSGIECGPREWVSPPLASGVTISGAISFTLWAMESSMSANAAINARVERLGPTGEVISEVSKSSRTTELTTSNAAATFDGGTVTSTAFAKGDRIRITVFADDAGTMGAGYSVDFSFGGSTGSSDSSVTFTETLTFMTTAPSATTVYLTDTDAAVLGASGNTGYKVPGTADTISDAGSSWVNPQNVYSSDNAYATTTLNASGSEKLRCTNFGISLPVGAVVTGFEFRLEGLASASGKACYARLVLNDTPTGSLKSTSDFPYPAETYVEYGNSTDMWGTTLGKSDIESASFGVDVSCPATSGDLSVDRVELVVHYAVPIDREAWTSRGGGVQNDVANTVDGPVSPIQFTDTAGGTLVEWYTKPLTAFTLAGPVLVNLRAKESADAGATIGCELAVTNGDGSSPVVWSANRYGGMTTNPSDDLTVTEGAKAFYLASADTSVANGQRLRIRVFIDDSLVAMTTGYTVTQYYAGTSGGASGDAYLTFGQTLTEYVTSRTISPSAIASAEAFGSVTVQAAGGALTISPSAVSSTEILGSATLAKGNVNVAVSSISSSQTVPSPVVVAESDVIASAISSAETFGTVVLTKGNVNVSVSSIASAESFGNVVLTKGNVNIAVSSIASAESFGSVVLTKGNVNVSVSAVASAESVGVVTLVFGGVIVQTTAIDSSEAIGAHTLQVASGASTISPTAIASDEILGANVLTAGAVTISTSAITAAETFGSITISKGGVSVTPFAIGTAETLGSATILKGNVNVVASAIATAGAYGTASILKGNVNVVPSAIDTAESVGNPSLTVAGSSLAPSAISSDEVLGSVVITTGNVNVAPSAITSAQVLGSPSVVTGSVAIAVISIASAESVSSAALTTAAKILPSAVATGESAGSPSLFPGSVAITAIAIASAEQFGTVIASMGGGFILATAIPSSETIGTATLINSATILAIAIGSDEAVASPIVTRLGHGIRSEEAFGAIIVTVTAAYSIIQPAAIESSETFGSSTVTPGPISIVASSIASSEAVGSHTLKASVAVIPSSITSSEALGSVSVIVGGVIVSVSSITSGEVVAVPFLFTGVGQIAPTGISSSEAFGTTQVRAGNKTLLASAIASAEASGSPTVLPGARTISHSAIASEEFLGTPTITRAAVGISPSGVGTEENLGVPTLITQDLSKSVLPTAIDSLASCGTPLLLKGLVRIYISSIPSHEQFGTPLLASSRATWRWINQTRTWGTTRKSDQTTLQQGFGTTRHGEWPVLQPAHGTTHQDEGEDA